ncbi:MAG: hypothetical protein J7K73_01080 [Nanoarchaeota archaeon]|nr:hypothetical protein [Nanoarchaeota archaeon]
MEKIIKYLSKYYTEEDKKIEIDPSKFHTYEMNKYDGKILAVDGGSGIVFDGGSRVISKIKIGVVEYAKGKMTKQDVKKYFMLAIWKNDGIIIKLDPDEQITLSNKKIDELQNDARDILERKMINEIAEKEKDAIILSDGLQNLSPRNVASICKTSRLKTKNGRSLIGYLNEFTKDKYKDKLWYYTISEGEYIVKFHTRSKFCYKVTTKNKEVNNLFGAIAYYSTDPEILGYPYPLLKVDKIVRLREDEKQFDNHKLKLLAKQEGVNLEFDENSMIMHDLLDKRAYR